MDNQALLESWSSIVKGAATWDEAKHPRAAHGRFGSGGASDLTALRNDELATPEQKKGLRSLFDGAGGKAKSFLKAVVKIAAVGVVLRLALAALHGSYRAGVADAQRQRRYSEYNPSPRPSEAALRAARARDRRNVLGFALEQTLGSSYGLRKARSAVDVVLNRLSDRDAQKVLDAMIHQISARDAQKLIDNADQFKPMAKIEPTELLASWQELLGKVVDSHGRHHAEAGTSEGGRFESEGGSSGSGAAYAGRKLRGVPWKEMTLDEKRERASQLEAHWVRQAGMGDERTRQRATHHLMRIQELADNETALLQSVGTVHDNMLASDLASANRQQPWTPQGQPGRGQGDLLQQALRRQQEAEEIQKLKRLRDQLGGFDNMSQEEARAALEAASRVRSEQAQEKFSQSLDAKTNAPVGEGVLGRAGDLLGGIVRTAFAAQSLVRNTASAGEAFTRGDYATIARAYGNIRNDLSSFRGELGTAAAGVAAAGAATGLFYSSDGKAVVGSVLKTLRASVVGASALLGSYRGGTSSSPTYTLKPRRRRTTYEDPFGGG